MAQKCPLVSIIILNWNNPTDTLACLRTVVALEYPADRLDVIVVDNGSTNDSVARIRAEFPDVKIIETGVNLGYAGGNNVGMRYALDIGCDYIWLLNDDILVAPDSLSILMQVAQATPEAALLGPAVYIREDPTRILSVGGPLLNGWQAQHGGLGEIDCGQYTTVRDVDYLSGCAILGRADALQKIGLLDEGFFAYHEDTDWCYRARKAGWRVLSVPQARVWHPDTRRRDGAAALVTYYSSRNQLFFLRKHRLGWKPITQCLMCYAVWIGNWSINPKWRHFRDKRNALWRAVYDFFRGSDGPYRWTL